VSDAYGSSDRPAYLDPFTEIVGFRSTKGRYVVLEYAIYRRMVSGAAMAGFNNPGAPADAISAYAVAHPEGDHIVETLISYTMSRPWPFTGSTYPAPPPYDIAEPNLAHSGAVTGTVTGAPALPGVSGFGADLICTFLSGYFGSTASQNNHRPAFRGRSSASPGGSPEGAGVPKPPSLGSVTNNWGSLAIDLQLYDPDSGFAVASTALNFNGLRIVTGDKTYEAYRAAVVPKEEDGLKRNPPFTGTVVGANNNFNRVDVRVLCRKRTS
jgi:hypothetical protein